MTKHTEALDTKYMIHLKLFKTFFISPGRPKLTTLNGQGNEVKGLLRAAESQSLMSTVGHQTPGRGRSQQKALPGETLLTIENQWHSAQRGQQSLGYLEMGLCIWVQTLHLVEGGKRHLTREQTALAMSSKTMDC